jgi:hypothetical protein
MPDWASIVASLKKERELQATREENEAIPRRRVMFIGWLAQAVIISVGFGLIFWQSAREWGSLPPAAGTGLLIYVVVACALAVVWVGAVYAWIQLREPF